MLDHEQPSRESQSFPLLPDGTVLIGGVLPCAQAVAPGNKTPFAFLDPFFN